MTSMSVCARIRRILHVEKVGHAGTLDPMAEGVLPVALGRACKSVEEAGKGIKTYEAGMLLGTVTDTQDITGKVLSEWKGALPEETEIREVINGFLGGYDQLTPMYSARQIDGRRLYDIARSGQTVERESRHIDIHSIEILEINGYHVRFSVTCSKGTYVRTICNDIGERLGCGACMESLKRTRVGDFDITDTIGFKEIETLEKEKKVDSALRVITPTAVAIGKFDGTHIGHQALLRELRKSSEEHRLRSLVLIIDSGKEGIEEREERRNRILSLGIDYVIELPLTKEIMEMSAEDFIRNVLIGRYSMRFLVGGKDISFGYRRSGNEEFLKANAARLGFHFKLIDKLKISSGTGKKEEVEVSSTVLRELLKKGKMEEVRHFMGKNYEINGEVIAGRHLATDSLSFPTVNVLVDENRELPPFGVYVTKTTVIGKEARTSKNDLTAPKGVGFRTYYGLSNLGKKPSINEGLDPLSLETHLIGEIPEEDLHGKNVRCELLHFLRPEKKFASMEELKDQIMHSDLPEAQKYINNACNQGSNKL